MYSLQLMEITLRQKNLCSESWLFCIELLDLLLVQQLKSEFSFVYITFCAVKDYYKVLVCYFNFLFISSVVIFKIRLVI